MIHAVLMRCLVGRAPLSDLFGKRGRVWLSELALPEEERESVEAALRQIEFQDREIAAVEQLIASDALESAEIRRLMSAPGVNLICAATFMAAIGEIGRFESPRKLAGYLGLDPRVSQSGSTPAAHGRISKQGSTAARHALVEASWSTIRQPDPVHAFYQRVRARRGPPGLGDRIRGEVYAVTRKLRFGYGICPRERSRMVTITQRSSFQAGTNHRGTLVPGRG